MLLRLAAYSRTACLAASIAAPILAIAPVPAVEAILIATLLVITGAASYWPTNLVAMGLGVSGAAGCLNSVLVWWETRRTPEQRAAARRPPATKNRGPREDDDGSGSLVGLTIGAIAAAIIGALP